ncbi:MAG: phage portal protein [Clostridiales bacterium]|nr:phage portal protein [Clostridiales bacterium]
MSWLDNLIGFISPEWGAKREIWRQYLDETRHYDAGGNDRLNAGWRATNQSAEYTDRYSRDTVRARAGDLERNSDMMNSVVGPFVRNTVGSGYVLQSGIKNQATAQKVEQLWKLWCKKQNCDVTGTQSFNQMLRMAVRRKKIDGGILFVKRYTSDGMIPFKLQLFEVDELDGSQVVPKVKGNRVVGGIEYNAYNRPVGYWIKQYAVDGLNLTDPVYIEAKDVIFYFTKRRPSQLREMSDMSQTVTRIRDANEFMTAVSVKQRIEACLSIFIKKQLPTTGIGRSGAGATGPRQTYAGKSLTPGMMMEMNAGDEVQVVNPQGQATDAGSFIKVLQRMIGAGQGLSYEATSRDMAESTYSSTRQSLIEDSMTYAEEEELLIEVMDEIYETFIISLVLAKQIEAPDFWNNKQDFFTHRWVKDPKPWIDPSKEAAATKTALQTGQKTFKQIAAENGSDWRTQVDDIAEVLDYARDKHGLDLGGVILGQTGIQQTEEPEPEPDPDPADGDEKPDEGDGDGEDSSSDSDDDGTESGEPAAS